MTLDLEQRLLRFLHREEEGEARSSQDLRALPVPDRVLEGECIQGAVFSGLDGGRGYSFSVPENLSKFRPGDAVLVGDGLDFAAANQLAYGQFDAEAHRLYLQRDPFYRGEDPQLVEGQEYCIDRRFLGIRGRLQQVVQAGFRNPVIADVFAGRHQVSVDEERRQRAVQALSQTNLNATQVAAGAQAIGTNSLALIQGPPGTGKTRLLAELLRVLCRAGCRIALSAFTHRAVDNVLLALRALDPDLPLVKLGNKRDAALLAARIRTADPRRGSLPSTGAVVGGTCFALAKLPARENFHYMVFDEAGQLPIPHAMAGMLLAQRWIFVGDHQQLPPVIIGEHLDSKVTCSVFELLHQHYGSCLLDLSYRMNATVCEVVGDTFYAGKLQSAVPDRRMNFSPGGRLDEVLDPELGVVLARVDHLQPGMRSGEEASLIADLVNDLRRQHGIAPADIAVVAPFRAQVRLIRSALQRKEVPGEQDIVVDTVERMQGQEREVVLISLAVGDPDTLQARANFFFSTNRLNVAISRARSKAVLVASTGAFMGLPMDPDSLRAASVFRALYQHLPQVDLSKLYCC